MNLGGVVHLNKSGLITVFALSLLFLFYISSSKLSGFSINHNKKINLKNLLSVAIKAAQNGGSEVVAIKDELKIDSKGKTKEGLNDPVTTADFKSHCAMKATLLRDFPTLTVVSEEAKTKCDDNTEIDFQDLNINSFKDVLVDEKDLTVWIDPLDATQEYTEKLYKYVTTMVCVALKGEPIIGVIYKPFSEITSWGWVDNGGSEDLKISQENVDNVLRFIVSRSHNGTIGQVLNTKFEGQKTEIISAAGAGYKVMEVIAGRADAYVHNTVIKKWDICAGHAILNTINGKMTTLKNNPITYSDITQPVNSDGLLATLKDHDMFIKHFL